MSEWDGIKGVAGWRAKLAALMDEAKRAAANEALDARMGVADRLNAFIENSRPQTPDIQRLDELAGETSVALMKQTVEERLAALAARSVELAQLAHGLDAEAGAASASADSIRLTKARAVVSTLTRSVDALNQFRTALGADDSAGLATSVEDLLGRIQALRTAIEGGASPSFELPAGAEAVAAFSDKALKLIVDFEGINQPGKWPGAASGITLGYGYDLGHVTADQFESDWAGCFTAEQRARLRQAIGKTGAAAAALAPRLADIKCILADSRRVLLACSIPVYVETTRRAFAGVDRLPLDAQGALVSLVYNRGGGMQDSPGKDNRREMRAIRDLVPKRDLAGIAAALRSMKRLWAGQGLDGLLRRRDAEAKLVESCIAPVAAPSFGLELGAAPAKRRRAKKPVARKVPVKKAAPKMRALPKKKAASKKAAPRTNAASKRSAAPKGKTARKKTATKHAAPQGMFRRR